MMAYWLFKSEPDVFSWDMLVAKGRAGEEWSGIRNYQARNNMRAMKLGEKGFFYYSNADRAIVGVVEVCKQAHRDSTADADTWDCVDIRAVEKMPKPVTLEKIKADPKLREMVLVKNSRLSVQPVTAAEWAHVAKLGGLKA
jgi:predicted RNA-binding protein with PUA-like domain